MLVGRIPDADAETVTTQLVFDERLTRYYDSSTYDPSTDKTDGDDKGDFDQATSSRLFTKRLGFVPLSFGRMYSVRLWASRLTCATMQYAYAVINHDGLHLYEYARTPELLCRCEFARDAKCEILAWQTFEHTQVGETTCSLHFIHTCLLAAWQAARRLTALTACPTLERRAGLRRASDCPCLPLIASDCH